MKESLKAKTKKELISIAKSKKIKGYSNKNKSEIIELILKNSSKSPTLSTSNILNGIWTVFNEYIRVIIITFAALIAIYVFFFTETNSLNENKELSENLSIEEDLPVFSNIDTSFNILILPFYPDKDCLIENIEYERQLIERFDEIKEIEKLNIHAEIATKYTCPRTITDIVKIGKLENANFVIWGFYDEDCNDLNKIKLKYYLIKPEIKELDRYGESEYTVLESFNKLREGFLQEDIDYIVKFVLSFKEEANGNINKLKFRMFLNPDNSLVINRFCC